MADIEVYSSFLNAPVCISEQTIIHIQTNHPNTYPKYRQEIIETVESPNRILKSKDQCSILFEKWFDSVSSGHYYIVATIKQNSVSYRMKTAFPSDKPAKGTLLWPNQN